MMRVAILTDTNSGISKEEAENIGIYVMPMPILIDGEVFYEGDKGLNGTDMDNSDSPQE